MDIDFSKWVGQSEARRAELRARGEVVPDDEVLPFGQSTYGHNFSMDKALKTLNEKELYKRVTCSICSDIPVDPMKTDVSAPKIGDNSPGAGRSTLTAFVIVRPYLLPRLPRCILPRVGRPRERVHDLPRMRSRLSQNRESQAAW